MRNTIKLIAVLLIAVNTLEGADWPTIAGPTRDQQSTEKGLMKTWPANGPKTLWTNKVGKGFGGVAIHSGKVYLLDRDSDTDIFRCFDLTTGNEEWSYKYKARGHFSFPGSRSHPSADDKYVFTLSPVGDLYCFDKSRKKPKWNVNVLKKAGGRKPNWAITQTPALYGDLVIVAPAGSKAGIMAFKKDTGALAWKSKRLSGKISYASPMPTTIDGVDQVMVVTTSAVISVDAKTGKKLWQTDAWSCTIPIASPFHLGKGKVFITGGYGAGCAMFQVKKRGSSFKVSTLFKSMDCNCQIHQPILYKNHLYMNGNDKSKRDGFICLDLNGKLKWQTKTRPGFDWGGILMADGLIYAVDGTKGDLCIIKPDPSGYREVARAKGLLKTKQAWGTIALSDGKLIIRDQTQIKCVDISAK